MSATTTVELWSDYCRFHALAVASHDVDPVYPVLARLLDEQGTAPEQRVEAVVIYLVYYHLGSGLSAYAQRRAGAGQPLSDLPLTLPTATERRAHRDRRQLARHLASLHQCAQMYGGLARFLGQDLPTDPQEAWRRVRERAETVHGNGRWASYKLAELLQQVCGWPLAAPDMGMAGASGPAHGLRLLNVAVSDAPADLEVAGAVVSSRLRAAGYAGTALSTVETTLCDFHSLASGGYYVGHDIDQMQTQLDKVPSGFTGAAYAARAATLPAGYLGEVHGWVGVDRARSRRYKLTGDIVDRPH
jgi:hypothetical protein